MCPRIHPDYTDSIYKDGLYDGTKRSTNTINLPGTIKLKGPPLFHWWRVLRVCGTHRMQNSMQSWSKWAKMTIISGWCMINTFLFCYSALLHLSLSTIWEWRMGFLDLKTVCGILIDLPRNSSQNCSLFCQPQKSLGTRQGISLHFKEHLY